MVARVTDKEELILSGSGAVSKEITDADLLISWRDVLIKWHQNLKVRPKQVFHCSIVSLLLLLIQDGY